MSFVGLRKKRLLFQSLSFVLSYLLQHVVGALGLRLFKEVHLPARSPSHAHLAPVLNLLQLTEPDSPCTQFHGDEKRCLDVGNAQHCMFLQLENAPSLCLPCTFGETSVPCPAEQSVFAMQKVVKCDMACGHQEVLTKVSPCTDVLDKQITKNQCMSKGDASETKCMWIQYDLNGQTESTCGPCEVGGVGTVSCYGAGNPGPEAGSKVLDCVSKCDEQTSEYGIPCGGGVPAVTPCFVTPAPPDEIAVTGVDAYKVQAEEGAPEYFAAQVPAPFGAAEFAAASKAAAKAAGWYPDTKLPPETPVMVWGGPPENSTGLPHEVAPMWGPAPPGIPGVPAPGTGFMGVLPNEPKP
ncbi:unnamed protein product [Amoebophrya sp. A120]|nr:unnamed protein product [Amoebophrya sp. A120]|eukprot:GSA120T00004418001.1